jgi:uncharacterized protein (UPF0335 family)
MKMSDHYDNLRYLCDKDLRTHADPDLDDDVTELQELALRVIQDARLKDRRIAELKAAYKVQRNAKERLVERIAELEAEVREWLCADCKTVYPGPPTKGFDCVICPKCKGRTGPKNTIRIAELEAKLEDEE